VSSFLYSTFNALPGRTRITGGVLPAWYRKLDLPVRGSDTAESDNGEWASGNSGSIRLCALAAMVSKAIVASCADSGSLRTTSIMVFNPASKTSTASNQVAAGSPYFSATTIRFLNGLESQLAWDSQPTFPRLL